LGRNLYYSTGENDMTKEQEKMFFDSFKALAKKDEEVAKRMHEHYLVAEKEVMELRKKWLEKKFSKRN
jgi:hypothetical protein